MGAPPLVSQRERDDAIARIADRHEHVEDFRRSEMGTEALEVLEYLQRNHVRMPRATAIDDVYDELVLNDWMWWAQRRREYALLRRARHLGVSLSELGSHLGIKTRQGTQDYLDRLKALLDHQEPDEALSRQTRRQAKIRPSQRQWIDTHRAIVQQVVSDLIGQIDRVMPPEDHGPTGTKSGRREETSKEAEPDDEESVEWLNELRIDDRDDNLTPGTFGLLGLVVEQLRVDPTVQALDLNHGLHRALRATERLRSAFAERATP